MSRSPITAKRFSDTSRGRLLLVNTSSSRKVAVLVRELQPKRRPPSTIRQIRPLKLNSSSASLRTSPTGVPKESSPTTYSCRWKPQPGRVIFWSVLRPTSPGIRLLSRTPRL
uniref:(northern house mosquito) hypothetical protein n=1 Tax=Culex pipiens TaxID=7175 RepID=A0A8D8AME0_CULPI